MPPEPGILLHLRHFPNHGRALQRRRNGQVKIVIAESYFIIYPVNTVCVYIVPVVTQFIQHVQQYQHAGSQPGGQPDNINGRIKFVLPQVSECGFKIISKHERDFIRWLLVLSH
jgi:hypothetical protein